MHRTGTSARDGDEMRHGIDGRRRHKGTDMEIDVVRMGNRLGGGVDVEVGV